MHMSILAAVGMGLPVELVVVLSTTDQCVHHRTARHGGKLEVMQVSCDQHGIVQSLLVLMLCGCCAVSVH